MGDQTEKKAGWLNFLRGFFVKRSPSTSRPNLSEKELHLEPKYWQEVIEFIDTLNDLIEIHTIDDPNLRAVNDRIVAYILEQINQKGSIQDIDQRYEALNTLTDRILTNNISKIAGLKQIESTQAEFSNAVKQLKMRLEQRHQEELLALKSK